MFKLPEEIIHGVKDYKLALEDYLSGKMGVDRFKGIRVPWGIYSQRKGVEKNIYMVRVRVPGGVIVSSQLRILAQVSKKHGNGMLHLTTRQDIQIHRVKIEDTGKILEELLPYNLSPRGGGGNTVRNIIACEFAGVCGKDKFNVIPMVESLSQYLLKDNNSYMLPRKYKIAFSGCREDCAGVRFNDLGFMALEKEGVYGFRVWAGGGMGAYSRLGNLLEEFVLPDEIVNIAEAVKKVFFQYGNRKNKHKARLRFLVEELGWDEFRKLYQKEKEKLEIKVSFSDEEIRKKVPGEVFEIRIPQGDLEAGKMEKLAGLKDDFPHLEFRLTFRQNIALVGFGEDKKEKLKTKLAEIFSGGNYFHARTSCDIVVCAGASTCNLGLCDSRALGRELERKSIQEKIKAVKGIEININGCPNACGHHPQAEIGLVGTVSRINGRSLPFYKVLIGGRRGEETAHLSEEIGSIPARRVPEFLHDFFPEIDEGVDIYGFLKEKGRKVLENLIEKYQEVPDYEQDKSFYRDWGKEEDFTLSGIGPGECGAGVIDMIESDLKDAGKELGNKNWKEAFYYAGRALLIVRGIEVRSAEEAIAGFKKEFVETGVASARFRNVEEVLENIEEGDFSSYIEDFCQEVKRLYRSMDNNFQFPKENMGKEKQVFKERVLDLSGVACPLNYVKTKLYLENIPRGERVKIILDEGEPMKNVPESLKNDGHKIIKVEKKENKYELEVEK